MSGGVGGVSSSPLVGIAISGGKITKTLVDSALEKFGAEDNVLFKLIHVRPKSILVPTEMGNEIPISLVREDVARAYRMDMESNAQKMVLPFKTMCIRKKVRAEIVIIEADDVPTALADEVAKHGIKKLVIGDRSRFFRRRKAKKLATRIASAAPIFCTVYAISDGKMSFIRPADVDGDSDSHTLTSSVTDGESSYASSSLSIPSTGIHRGETPSFGPSETEEESEIQTRSWQLEHVDLELQKLRIELRHAHEINAMAQNEAFHASRIVGSLDQQLEEREEKLKAAMWRESETEELVRQERNRHEEAKNEAEYLREMAAREASKARAAEKAAERDWKERENLQNALNGTWQQFETFSWDDIVSATSSFSEAQKIGRGAYGTVYKCVLRHTAAAVKILHPNRGSYQLRKEIEVLSKIRHPHLLTVLGACPERGCIVFEYMENGSLEDRLCRTNNTPPISWQSRFRIAWEIGSALVFLHNSKPKPVVHRDLKPGNILLDRNMVSKIGDVGVSTMISTDGSAHSTAAAGTLCYIDPEDQRTGLVSTQSDVFAFGIVLLQLLTGKPPMGLPSLVETALGENRLREVLDVAAGDWPAAQAGELAVVGLKCSELLRRDRPDLEGTVLPRLHRLNQFGLESMSVQRPPAHFMCPILNDVMIEPCVAADGYTYDRAAMNAWLRDNDTSYITGSPLGSKDLWPNYTLRAAIDEWRSQNLR